MPRSRRLTKPRGGCRASRRRCTGTRGPPVNPTPIAGLERHLHRRQGDARLALRAVRKAVLERNREGRSMISTTTERTRGPTRRPDAIWTSASAIEHQTAATIGAACDATVPECLQDPGSLPLCPALRPRTSRPSRPRGQMARTGVRAAAGTARQSRRPAADSAPKLTEAALSDPGTSAGSYRRGRPPLIPQTAPPTNRCNWSEKK